MCQFKIGDEVTIRTVNKLNIHIRGHGLIQDNPQYPIGAQGIVTSSVGIDGCIEIQIKGKRGRTCLLVERLHKGPPTPVLTTQERVFARRKLLDERFEQRKAKKEYDKTHPTLSIQDVQPVLQGVVQGTSSPSTLATRQYLYSSNF